MLRFKGNTNGNVPIKRVLIKIFNIVLGCIFYYLFILNIGTMNLQSPISSILILPICLIIIFFFKKEKFLNTKNILNWYVLQGISGIIMIVVVYWLDVKISWDWGRLLESAYNYTMTEEIDYPQYFMRYPNNQFWLVCLIGLFKLVKVCTMSVDFRVYKAVSIVISIFIVQLTIHFIYKTAKLLWDEKKAFLVGMVAIFYVPFYLYAMFLYNDTTGAFIAVLLLFYDVKQNKENNDKKKYLLFAIIGIWGAMALHVKVLVFIVFIAIVIEMIFHYKIKLLLGLLGVLVLTFVGTHVLLEMPVKNTLGFDKEESAKWEFPSTHWIMMALNSYGGFSQDDVNFTWGFDTYEEKKEQNILKIKERIYDRGFIETVKHIFYTKQLRTWTNSCLAGDNYVSRNPLHEQSLCQKVFSYKGEWHWVCLIYTWIYHITIMLGILLSAIMSIKMKISEQKLLSGKIAIFGLFLFLSIWECNSRYVFSMAPVMILVAADGIFMTLNWIEHKKGILCNEKVC